MALHTIDKVEVFAVGKWNGYPFTEEDLNTIVNSFNKLKEVHKVPLKFGHNEDQPMKDGHMSLGWVDDLFVENGLDGTPKLMAKMSDIPDVVFKAIKYKRYRKVSIELDFDVSYKEKFFKYVLSGIALLGADLPAVNTLADIAHYMNRQGLSFAKRVQFSALDGDGNLIKETGKVSITEEEMQAKLDAQAAKLKAEFSAKSTDDKKDEELKAAKERIAKFEREQAKAEKLEKEKKIKLARESVEETLNGAVKDMLITPAQKESFSKLLGVDNDEQVINVNIEDVKQLIGDTKKVYTKEHSGSGNGGGTASATPGETLHDKALEYKDDHPKVSYSRALEIAMKQNPDLASEHINATYGEA